MSFAFVTNTPTTTRGHDGCKVDRYGLVGVLFDDRIASTTYLALKEDAGQPSDLVTLTRVTRPLASLAEVRHAFFMKAKLASNVHDVHFMRPDSAFVFNDDLFVAGRHAAGARLSEVLAAARSDKKDLPLSIVLRIFLDVAHGLRAFFEASDEVGTPLGLAHGDITTNNIVITTHGVAALVHSGLVVTKTSPSLPPHAASGLLYKAPEQLAQHSYVADATPSGDVFSFGVALAESLGARLTTTAEAAEDRFSGVREHLLRSLPLTTPQAVVDIVARCLAWAPEERFADPRDLASAMDQACDALNVGAAVCDEDVATFIVALMDHALVTSSSKNFAPSSVPAVWRLAPILALPPPSSPTHTRRTAAQGPPAPRQTALQSIEDIDRGMDPVAADRSALRSILGIVTWLVVGMIGVGAVFWLMVRPVPRPPTPKPNAADTANADESAFAPAPTIPTQVSPPTCSGVDHQRDPKNCGFCGRDCLGGTCVAGACQPVVIAEGQTKASNVVLDSDAVYWTANGGSGGGTVVKASLTVGEGGTPPPTPTVLATGLKSPDGIAVDGNTVYVTTADSIVAIPTKGGGAPKVLADKLPQPTGLRARGGHVYWTSMMKNGSIMTTSGAAGNADRSPAPKVVADHIDMPCDVAVDDHAIYFTSYGGGAVFSVPLSGDAPPTVLASKQSFPCSIAVNKSGVYWLNSGSAPAVMHVDPKGGAGATPNVIATDRSAPVTLALSEEQVYWTSTSTRGALLSAKMKKTRGGGGGVGGDESSPTTVPVLSGQGNLSGLAFANGTLYFANYGTGNIGKVAVEVTAKTVQATASADPMTTTMPAPPASVSAASSATNDGGVGGGGGDVAELKIASVGNTMAFNTTSLTVKAGQKVHLTFQNVATMAVLVHNWVLVKPGTEAKVAEDGLAAGEPASYTAPNDPNILASTKLAKGGETVDVTFTAPPAGTYPFVCTMPGHYIMMKGKLTVTP